MLTLLIVSFLAGILTVASPCVLPVLPVVLGSSLAGEGKWRPYFVTLGLAISISAFTLLLKSGADTIGLGPDTLRYISAALVTLVGIAFLFPNIWSFMSEKLGFESKSHAGLSGASEKSGIAGALLSGVALGPVFASCSPVYAVIIATVLRESFTRGAYAVAFYSAGLALALLLIALLGRTAVKKMGWLAKPDGWFRRITGLILIVMAVLIAFDLTTDLQVKAAELWPGFSTLEGSLADKLYE